RLAEETQNASIGRALVLCSASRRDEAAKAIARFDQGVAFLCDASQTNIPREAYDNAMADLEAEGADGIIAFGGGSPIGLGKAMAAKTGLPLIAVATTYSGSERAPNWYIGVGAAREQGAGLAALPAAVIYDPDLTLGLPPAVSAASGMNAMAHAVESLYGPDTNPVIQALSEEAIRKLAGGLKGIVADGSNIEARHDALYGAWLAAQFRATSGLEHVLAQQIRSRFTLGHALCHAIAVPYAIAYNAPAAPDAMVRIERALGVEDAGSGLYELNRALGLATGYVEIGMPENGLDDAVDAIMGRKFPNPRAVTRDELKTVVGQAMKGGPPRF
ncbi:MAG: iron-containing alcohol dehydrogenase, partial [Alphaproteobacteria bacterium]